ncbi:MAG: MarR family winged helix-turn-helix transcriptional regulator [Gemmatimonadota bacterium]
MTPTHPNSDEAPAAEPAAAVERAMVRLRRSMTRHTIGRRMASELEVPFDMALIGVVDAVDQGPDESGAEVTVGAVGERLGIDPSRASRVVSAAIEGGYVRRLASQADGRRSVLELTDAGRELVAAARRTRRRFFDEAMRGWPEEDRRTFARLLGRFVDALGEERPG